MPRIIGFEIDPTILEAMNRYIAVEEFDSVPEMIRYSLRKLRDHLREGPLPKMTIAPREKCQRITVRVNSRLIDDLARYQLKQKFLANYGLFVYYCEQGIVDEEGRILLDRIK